MVWRFCEDHVREHSNFWTGTLSSSQLLERRCSYLRAAGDSIAVEVWTGLICGFAVPPTHRQNPG